MKKLRIVLVICLIFSCVIFSSACAKKKKSPIVSFDIDESVYYLFGQKLSSINVVLDDESSKGSINWLDDNQEIRKGKNELKWKFTSTNKRYKNKTGSVVLYGYDLIDLSNIEIPSLIFDYTGANLNQYIRSYIKETYFSNLNINIFLVGEFIEQGVYYNVGIKITSSDNFEIFKYDNLLTKNVTIPITIKIKKAQVQVELVSDRVELGEKPEFNFSLSGSDLDLVEGEDYIVSYYTINDNVLTSLPDEIGFYKVRFIGLNENEGLVKTFIFEIYSNLIQLPNVNNISSVNYNGSSQIPNIVITGLTSADYTVSWKYKSNLSSDINDLDISTNNFIEAGEYFATIVGKGNYTGARTVSYIINKINRAGITIVKNDDYFGSLTNPSLNNYQGDNVVYYYNELASVEGAKVFNTSVNLNAGNYFMYAIISADNNYNQYKTPSFYPFEVKAVALTGVNELNYEYDYTGETVLFDILTGRTKDTDYTLTNWQYKVNMEDDYELLDVSKNNFTNVGFYKTVANGINNYTGSVNVIVEIKKINSVSASSAEGIIKYLPNSKEIVLSSNINDSLIFSNLSNVNCKITMNDYKINSMIKIENVSNFKLVFNGGTDSYRKAIVGGNIETAFDISASSGVEIVLDNLDISANNFGIKTNKDTDGASLTVNNCSIFSASETGCGAYLPAGYNYEFTNCYIAGATGMYCNDGYISITNCGITGSGENKLEQPILPGSEGEFICTGDALTIDSNSNLATSVIIELTEVSLMSVNAYALREGATKGEGYLTISFTNLTLTSGAGLDYRYYIQDYKLNLDFGAG